MASDVCTAHMARCTKYTQSGCRIGQLLIKLWPSLPSQVSSTNVFGRACLLKFLPQIFPRDTWLFCKAFLRLGCHGEALRPEQCPGSNFSPCKIYFAMHKLRSPQQLQALFKHKQTGLYMVIQVIILSPFRLSPSHLDGRVLRESV